MNRPKLDLGFLGIFLFVLLAPISVSGWYRGLLPGIPTSAYVAAGCAGLLAIQGFRGELRTSATNLLLAAAFFVPALVISSIGLSIQLVLGNEYVQNPSYLAGEMPSRLANLLLYAVLFFLGSAVLNAQNERRLRLIASAYVAGAGVLIIVGLWQWAHYYAGAYFPELSTRTVVHGVPEVVRNYVPARLTSLADEPSYLAPPLIEVLIISFVAIRSGWSRAVFILVPGVFVLLFSFSLGGYINAFLLLFYIMGLIGIRLIEGKGERPTFLIGIGLVLVAVASSVVILGEYVGAVLGRIHSLSTVEGNSRAFMSLMPVVWATESGFWALIFGHGPNAYAAIGALETLPSGAPVQVTSNNLFGDMLFEGGLLGLAGVLFFFWMLWCRGFRFSRLTREHYLGSLLVLHLAISELYRADFVSPRFWAVVFLILAFYRLGDMRRESLYGGARSPVRRC